LSRNLICAALIMVVGAACSSDDGTATTSGATTAGAPTEAAVSIADFAFTPNPVTVAVGGTVSWTNEDGLPHTTTSQSGAWNSEALQPSETFSFTFEETGTFDYVCNIHPSMSGTITVEG